VLYKTQPLQSMGIEGVGGLIISGILLIIFNNVSCTPQLDSKGKAQFCPFGLLEDSMLAFRQIAASAPLAGFVAAYMIAMTMQAYSGTVIIKFGSSMQRSVLACLRSLGVWIVSLSIGWEGFIWLQVIHIIHMCG